MTSGAAGPHLEAGTPSGAAGAAGKGARGAGKGGGGKLASIKYNRMLFEEAVETARRHRTAQSRGDSMLGAGDEQLIEITLRAFDALMRSIETHSEDHVQQQSERLAQRRAYILPVEEILAQSKEIAIDLRQWGVPAPVLAEVDDLIKGGIEGSLKDKNFNQVRASFRRLIEREDYWEWYIERFNGWNRMASYLFAPLALALMFAAGYVYFSTHHALTGLMLAGASGAAVSILLKPPQVSIYAEWAPYLPRTLGRFVAGIAAAGLGVAVLASGLVEVRMPSTGQTTSQVLLCQAREATEVAVSAPAAAPPGSPAPAPCSNVGAGVLLALAFVFGFTERALTTLEDTLAKPFGFNRGDQTRSPQRDDDGGAGNEEEGKAGHARDTKAPADDKQPV